MAFRRAERSYFSTPEGWRLATFKEATDGLDTIKKQNLLKKWDRARLLDGWITGPGYKFQMGNDFKGCLGYMLLIQTEASGCAYAGVDISDSQKQVALFLCADDCNYEVVYWLFNTWAERDGMHLYDVIKGRTPFNNRAKFVKFVDMNKNVCSLARKLGDLGSVSEKAAKKKFSGPNSVTDVLSEMIQIVSRENLVGKDKYVESFFPRSLEPDWLKDLAEQGGAEWNNIADAFWNFLGENFAETMVGLFADSILDSICKLNDEYDLKTDFMVVSFILFYLSKFRTDIIHTPLAHDCMDSCVAKMICQVASNYTSADLPRFKETLEINAMWRPYNQIGNYDLLNKLLVLAASGYASMTLKRDKTHDIFVVNRLLVCGAQLGPDYGILGRKRLTALHAAVRFIKDEVIEIEVAESLLNKSDGIQQQQLADTPMEDEDGWTPLQFVSRQGHARTCRLLLKYGADLSIRDKDSKTALHIAIEGGKDAVINVFLEHPQITEIVDVKDNMDKSPIDTAVGNIDIKLVAKLISKSKQPQAYFHKVDSKQLLRYSLLDGFSDTVRKLFEKGTELVAGECDDEGKTALHLAAMCEDDSKAMETVRMVVENIQGKEKFVVKHDRRGRTALQEAALNGNEELCRYLLNINPEVINLKDRDGRNAIYDAAEAKQNEEVIMKMFLGVYSTLNALIDRHGLTVLHVAASLGKKDLVKLLVEQEDSEYLTRSDFLGQTALHKAVNCGDSDTVKILLNKDAHPLKERDCDGRTALHYAVQAKTGGDKIVLANLLLERCKPSEEKLLLLWASAAGVGTADQSISNDDKLHKFLVGKKEEITKQLPYRNLLKVAATVGDIEMTKELIGRGYEIADIRNKQWRDSLAPGIQQNVDRVSDQLERIAEQGNDRPTVLDYLGRSEYAHGLAALLLNPYIKPPIVVGISGTWGMGKSSLMVQTESILLKTAAQMALLSSAKLSSLASELPEITTSKLSKEGKKKYEEIKRLVDYELKGSRSLFSSMIYTIWSWVKKSNTKESRPEIEHTEQDSLADFLNNYQPKYHKVFKSLAAMDSTNMFTERNREDQEPQNPDSKSMRRMLTKTTREDQDYQNSHSKTLWGMLRNKFTATVEWLKSSAQQSTADSPEEGRVPAVLTVRYNAWKYRNETEAMAGMAVEITKELEGIMTRAQWLSTCWRNTWKKKKYNIWIEIIYPCLLAVVLASTVTWILWVILNRSDKFKDWAIPKFALLPTAIVIIAWTITKLLMGILKPVSTQLMNYISFPDHTDKLGYQERVISDITFLKDEIGKRPRMVFKACSWVYTVISTLWVLFFEWRVMPLFFHPRILGNTMLDPNIAPASGMNLRIIVFIDDLDRCQESVILQVLSAINLILAECEISVVLGIDKRLIERAIIKKYGDMKANRSFKDNQELADMYLQKIIQLPLDLPDPSEEQSRIFLEGQLGIFQEPSEGADSEVKPDAGMAKLLRQKTEAGNRRESTSRIITESETGAEIVTEVTIDMQTLKGRKDETEATTSDAAAYLSVPTGRKDEMEPTTSEAAAASLSGQTGTEARQEVPIAKRAVNKISNRNYWSRIPLREMLFVKYSKGEREAFCYFQTLVTDSRKLPREWKRYLTYHRLVWNIFYLTREAKDVPGWQVKLITWIFVCWEWREKMDIVIQNWDKIRILKSSPSKGPSLQMIVDHFIELETKENLKMTETSHEEEETNDTKRKVSVSNDKTIETESSKSEQKKPEEADEENMVTEDVSPPQLQGKKKKNKKKKKKEDMEVRETSLEGNIDDWEGSKRAGPQKLDTAVNKQLDTMEKTLRKELDELKKEIKDLKDQVMKQQSKEELDKLKKENRDLKDLVKKQQSKKNEKREEEKSSKLKRWETLMSALDKYDVPMNAIQIFQRFRFYCIAGHLSWPLSEQVQRKKEH